MSAPTHRHRGTALRTAISLLLLTLTAAPANARERALHLQLEDAPEEALPGLLERMATSKPEGDARVAATQAVAKLLERGQSDGVTDRALETLGAFGSSAAGPVLAQYAHHRRVAARARAYTALARVAGTDRALRALVADGLRDSAPEVRAAAARSVEALRVTEATPLLLKAVGRGVPEAAVTLGAVGEVRSLDAYHAYLRKQPLDVMLSGYERWMLRPDLSEKAKLDVIARLEDVSGPLVLRFTSAMARQSQLPAAVRQAASAATLRIGKAQAQPAAAAPNAPASASAPAAKPAPTRTSAPTAESAPAAPNTPTARSAPASANPPAAKPAPTNAPAAASAPTAASASAIPPATKPAAASSAGPPNAAAPTQPQSAPMPTPAAAPGSGAPQPSGAK